MTDVRDEYIRTKGENFNEEDYRKEYDAFLEKHFGKTMGTVANRVYEIAGLDDLLKGRIKEVKDRRDFLVHSYWRSKIDELDTRAGRSGMIEELELDIEVFEKLERDIYAALKATRERLGIKDEIVEARLEEEMAKIRTGFE